MLFNLQGKFAVITGANGGIGRAIAKTLHQQGATVGLASMNISALENFAKTELKDRYVVFKSTDLSNASSIEELVTDINNHFPVVDILVNNAGITKDSLAIRMKKDDWDEVINTNLTSNFLLSKPIFAKMLKQRYGRIINIASVVGVMGNIGQINYSASKGGVIALTKSLAKEGASRGVTVNSIAPGFVNTKMLQTIPQAQMDEMLKSIPLARTAEPQEIAAAVAFLASAEAGYITGHTLDINGGLVMQ